MSQPTRYSPRFFRDVAEVFEWYEGQQTGVGGRFRESLRQLTNQIESNPEAFFIVEDRVRMAQVRNFPYGVYFELFETETVIFAVIHLSRDPSTWMTAKNDIGQ